MSSSGAGPWNVLSGAIRRKVDETRQKHNAAEAQERQNEFDLVMEGVRAHAANGTLTDEMLEQAKGKMQKLVPKESHPLVDAFTKIAGHVRDARKKKAGQPNQPAGPAAKPPAGQPVPQGTSGGGSPAPPAPPAATPAQTPTQATPNVVIPPTPQQQAVVGALSQVAAERITSAYRGQVVDNYRKSLQGKRELSPRENEVLDMWAMGVPVTSATLGGGAGAFHPVIIKDPKNPGVRIPAMQSKLPPFEVYGTDGEVVANPEILSAAMRPHVGWGQDRQGWYSFNIDPETNQPMKGTLSRAAEPPPGYLQQTKLDAYHYVDDSGGVHEHRFTTKSGKQVPLTEWLAEPAEPGAPAVPSAATPSAAPAAVPPAMRGPKGKGTGAGTSTTPAAAAKSDVIGTKDTGVLSGPAQTVITKTQPVLDQVDKLLGDIDRLKLGSNNTPGYLFTARLKYGVGIASPEGSLASDIAGLSLGSVVEAASALQGSSRSVVALKKALEHTPNPWKDSPKLIREKLNTIKDRLNDVVRDANVYGRKRTPSTVGPGPIPKNMQAPKTADQQAEEWLAR